MKNLLFSLLLIYSSLSLFAQQPSLEDYEIQLKHRPINEIGGLQSFAFAQHNGLWLILGGRLDGLHRRQPWASFDKAGHNNHILVIDPNTGKKWSLPLQFTAASLNEQCRSTNMEFIQTGNNLYLVGGYGYSDSLDNHITFPFLTTIQVKETIEAVQNGKNPTPYFRQIKDSLLAVTGGVLQKIGNTYYLTGGQRFDGKYNPMGPDRGPGFIQQYTNSIRRFQIHESENQTVITFLSSWENRKLLHRRDLNVVPQLLPNGELAFSIFSGVFREDLDLPFYSPISVSAKGFQEEDFRQYLNHYHCASIPIYFHEKNEMHSVFIGGIAQFFINNDTIIQDDNVPFVKTIGRVIRNAKGEYTEMYNISPLEHFIGSGAHFLIDPSIPQSENGVILFDKLEKKPARVGYIYGGIKSQGPTIFWENEGDLSEAHSGIYEVWIYPQKQNNTWKFNPEVQQSGNLELWSDTEKGLLEISLDTRKRESLDIFIYDSTSQLVFSKKIKKTKDHRLIYDAISKDLKQKETYLVVIKRGNETIYRKIKAD